MCEREAGCGDALFWVDLQHLSQQVFLHHPEDKSTPATFKKVNWPLSVKPTANRYICAVTPVVKILGRLSDITTTCRTVENGAPRQDVSQQVLLQHSNINASPPATFQGEYRGTEVPLHSPETALLRRPYRRPTTPIPLGPPYDPGHRATVGSLGGRAISYWRGKPVL